VGDARVVMVVGEPREPDEVTTWKSFTVAVDDICAAAGIEVPPGAEIEVDVPDRTSIRFTVKYVDTATARRLRHGSP
jgi:hypothetical protein